MTAPSPATLTTYVVGHRNPDADAVCSAIAYAAYKEARGERGFIPARCGNSNARIDTILARFRQPLPLYLSDVSPRVRDLMVRDVLSLAETATCAEALALFDQHDIRVIPITDAQKRAVGTVSLSALGGVFIPRLSDPKLLRLVHTSLANIARTLQGQALHLVREDEVGEFYVRLGTMDIASFWSISIRENIPADRAIIIVGDRRDVQRRAIEIGVRAIVITSNLGMDDATLALAQQKGTSVVVSPYDSATTAWIVRTASLLKRTVEREFATVDSDERIADVRKRFTPASPHALFVTDAAGGLAGILTKTDLLRPPAARLVLVDHNELSQAVPGAAEVTIAEIIDHHRLGAVNTPQPILFLNEPVGSTCTIVADLFRREGLQPSPEIAGIMMSGLISDTLHLHGPTTTGKDAVILAWLAEIAGVASKDLADQIFNSGSVILANPPDKIVRSDHKIYEEEGVRFSVSQVEELGFGNFWQNATPIADALQDLRDEERLAFAALLVTDINTQNSLLLVKGDPDFIRRISYAHVQQNEIFDLPGVVSRKKQLIPYLTSLLREMAADGTLPSVSAPPFRRKKS
ncbi:MAG TPA: putative manganese-dependent inorganic diphosphatase [Opitutus sp.]|nr:putative manganese-dependent inorganic diphosphatase [Opitutus sp.]